MIWLYIYGAIGFLYAALTLIVVILHTPRNEVERIEQHQMMDSWFALIVISVVIWPLAVALLIADKIYRTFWGER